MSAYAMGWYVKTYRGHTWLQHSGGIDGFTALVSLLPKEGIGVVAMTNTLESWICIVAALDAFDRLLGVEEELAEQRTRAVIERDLVEKTGCEVQHD